MYRDTFIRDDGRILSLSLPLCPSTRQENGRFTTQTAVLPRSLLPPPPRAQSEPLVMTYNDGIGSDQGEKGRGKESTQHMTHHNP